MKLTEQQQELVAKNHNLIFSYIHTRGLPVDEWYDVFAITLCKVAMCYDSSKGKLSTFFYKACENTYLGEIKKNNYQKRKHSDLLELREFQELNPQYVAYREFNPQCTDNEIDTMILKDDLFNSKDGQVLKLLYEGYTQGEISKMLGLSQSQISKIRSRCRDEYGN